MAAGRTSVCSGSGSAPKRKAKCEQANSGNKGSDSNSAVAGDDKSVRNNGSNYKRGNAAGGAEGTIQAVRRCW